MDENEATLEGIVKDLQGRYTPLSKTVDRTVVAHRTPSSDDPEGMLFLSGRFVERLRVRHFSNLSLVAYNLSLRLFRNYCAALDITRARDVTRATILNYQSYLFHYRKPDGFPLAVGTQMHRLSHGRCHPAGLAVAGKQPETGPQSSEAV
jgi:hypothetical protein